MAALAISAAGAAIGGFVAPGVVALGVTGAQIGWMAGSLLGSAFAPTQKSQGPRLGDLSVSSSAYGSVIPYVQGHPRIAGSIVWASQKREIATTTEEGKGGGAEYTSYTYEVDLLILLTDNVIGGVSRIWSSGGLIWSGLVDAGVNTLLASGSTSHWQRMTVYTGDAGQLPDPTYEAAVGTANAPAYRGRGSIFIQGLQLGGGGQLPNLTFEVFTSGGWGTGTVVNLLHFDESTETFRGPLPADPNYGLVLTTVKAAVGPDWVLHGHSGNNVVYNSSCVDPAVAILGRAALRLNEYQTEGNFSNAVMTRPLTPADGVVDFELSFIHNSAGHAIYGSSSTVYCVYGGNGGPGDWSLRNEYSGTGRRYAFYDGTIAIATGNINMGVVNRIAVSRKAGVLRIFVNGALSGSISGSTGALKSSGLLTIGGRFSGTSFIPNDYGSGIYDEFFFVNGLAIHTATFAPETTEFVNGSSITIAAFTEPTIGAVASALCQRAGLSPAQYDVAALAAITKPVHALAVSQISSARSVLETLMGCYFFDSVLSDKIYFRPRGSASAATIVFDDLGVSVDGGGQADPFPLRNVGELELPAQLFLTYSNIDGDYQTDTQESDRLLTGQESTSPIQVPLGFTPAEAKAIVDTMLFDQAAGFARATVSVGMEYARLEPGDVITMVGEDLLTYRMRIIKRTEADGVLTLDLLLDDATVLVQPGITTGGTGSQTIVLPVPDTRLELLDIPILRDADDRPGHYIAIKGSADNWRNAGLYASNDGISYDLNTTINTQAVFGSAGAALGNFTGGWVFDEVNMLTVYVERGQLSSATRDQVLESAAVNAALIGNELIQFRTATLISTGVYQLSSLLRGRRGTEWAIGTHSANERFVALGNSGMRYIELQTTDLGKLRYYKAASAGQRLSDVTAKTITPMGVELETFRPVDVRADRTTTDTILSWKRRTRLATRLVGPLPISAPLGEAAEAYEVEVYSSAAFTTLKRTLTSSMAAVTYSNAQQITDFGSAQAVLYLKIYQLSSLVGRGYPMQAAV